MVEALAVADAFTRSPTTRLRASTLLLVRVVGLIFVGLFALAGWCVPSLVVA
jgi:hypothetical protein